ncbi:MAG: hypothetical protein RXS25_00165 [Paraburkholderia sp.]
MSLAAPFPAVNLSAFATAASPASTSSFIHRFASDSALYTVVFPISTT